MGRIHRQGGTGLAKKSAVQHENKHAQARNAPERAMAELGIHVVDDGGSQLPVVFMHAFPLNSTMWQAQREALRGHGRFIAFDVRGLGKSPLGSTPCMLEHVVDDLLSVLDSLRIESALLCGISMGGYVALRAVERAPERVRGLLLANTQAAAESDEGKLKRADALRKLGREGLAAYAETWLRGALSARTMETRSDVVSHVRELIMQSSPAGVAACLLTLATRTDTSAALAKIQVPTRILVGEQDAITPPALARALCEKIAHANVHVLPGAGHLSALETPDAFNALLIQHIERVAHA
jgi:3-oxoadipate enol-lactonase